MKRTFGTSDPSNDRPVAATRHVFRDRALELRWAHCSATADFLSDLLSTVASRAGFDSTDTRHSIAYLVNELLENAIKFRAPGDIELEAAVHGATFSLWLANSVSRETGEQFQLLLQEIVAGDPGDLLIARIEANAASDGDSGSGLGILTLMNDYGVALSWSFEDDVDDRVRLETLAIVALS